MWFEYIKLIRYFKPVVWLIVVLSLIFMGHLYWWIHRQDVPNPAQYSQMGSRVVIRGGK